MITVWTKDALDAIPERYRVISTVGYPVIYTLLFLGFGVYGSYQGGSKAVQDVSVQGFPNLVCAAIGVAALTALIPAIFGWGWKRKARAEWMEVISDIVLVCFTTMYLVLLFAALSGKSAPVAAMTWTAIGALVLSLRGADLIGQITLRRALTRMPA